MDFNIKSISNCYNFLFLSLYLDTEKPDIQGWIWDVTIYKP